MSALLSMEAADRKTSGESNSGQTATGRLALFHSRSAWNEDPGPCGHLPV